MQNRHSLQSDWEIFLLERRKLWRDEASLGWVFKKLKNSQSSARRLFSRCVGQRKSFGFRSRARSIKLNLVVYKIMAGVVTSPWGPLQLWVAAGRAWSTEAGKPCREQSRWLSRSAHTWRDSVLAVWSDSSAANRELLLQTKCHLNDNLFMSAVVIVSLSESVNYLDKYWGSAYGSKLTLAA